MSSILHWVGDMSPESFLLLSILCFLAAFIDSIAGGGGMISLPAFMAVGLPPHIALGTNKVSAAIGTLASSLNFLRSNKIIIPLVTRFAPLALIGAIFGVKTALLIPPNYFQPISFFLLICVFIYSLMNKNLGESYSYSGIHSADIKWGCAFAFVIGFYDGFLGPGTGSFLIFMLIKIFHLDFAHATATTKFINLASNVISAALYFYAGKLNLPLGLIMAVIMIVGAFVGSSLAIYKGSKFIKPVFLLVTITLIGKMGYSFLFI